MNTIQDRNLNDDTSMEDILSSIRQILASDEDIEEKPNTKKVKPYTETKDDVLELTEEVTALSASVSSADSKPVEAKPAVKPLEAPRPNLKKEESLMTTQAPTSQLNQAAHIISEKTVEAANQALSKLSEALHTPQPTAAPVQSTHIDGSMTLEALVTQAMQPILKDWMDQNLPQVIERVVSAEIKKIVRQAI